MNAHQSTPTQIATTGRSRAIVVMFAGLLILAAAVIGSFFALSPRTPAAEISAHGPANHLLIAHCRPCQDEALAARQTVDLAAGRAAPSTVVGAPHHALITNCRICRDEALGASQASFRVADSDAMFLPLDDPRQSGPR
jgi:hypothetical protein